ncbi:quaternary ammonium compound efflux SMR transporter SugE [Rhodoligotrophos defluvii]|uniref:quaternary ammonium compound efflux SMR transporter SugE n=1 Tax=Rhodoligotrophos defluvii TaxID=2561934 RepID=UPI0010C93960|nr:quaternary ammonium compound efflux SMR transporter SugE [Rhodoligotrophos defluvii]
MAWVYLVVAGLFEVVWAFSMKASEGFTKPLQTTVTLITMVISFGLLAIAMRSLPLGTAYATWTGIGAIGAFIVGVIVLGEEASLLRLASAGLILAGIVGLKISADS